MFEPLTVGVDPDPPVIQDRAPVTLLAGDSMGGRVIKRITSDPWFWAGCAS